MSAKQQLGQYFTRRQIWIRPQIVKFIKSARAEIIYDPFAGDGDLLKTAQKIGFRKIVGLDIDAKLKWKNNDSLINIPRIKKSMIITNPPYLTNYSAKRKKIYSKVKKYFKSSVHNDLYKIALEKCLDHGKGVIIIPETFINSSFPKNRINSITIVEENPFEDTENPICIVCFDGKEKPLREIYLYKNNELIGSLEKLEKLRLRPTRKFSFRFNDTSGSLALRAVDTTNPEKPIMFMRKEALTYNLLKIKHSSRLITVIKTSFTGKQFDTLIEISNNILKEFRYKTADVLLSPFKGNKKDGSRRRRLDYSTARAILESAGEKVALIKH